MEENELTILAINQNTESLQQKLTDLNKINEHLTTTYKNQEDLLRKDLNTKQEEMKAAIEEKNQKQKEIDDLQDKLKEEKSNVSQKLQLISDLKNDKQKIKADAENCKQERDQLFKANSDYAERTKHLEQQIDQLQSKLEGKDEVIATEKDTVIADLKEKLKTQEHQVTQNNAAYEEHISKYASLEQEYKILQEKFKKQQTEGSQVNICKKIGDTPGSQLQHRSC